MLNDKIIIIINRILKVKVTRRSSGSLIIFFLLKRFTFLSVLSHQKVKFVELFLRINIIQMIFSHHTLDW